MNNDHLSAIVNRLISQEANSKQGFGQNVNYNNKATIMKKISTILFLITLIIFFCTMFLQAATRYSVATGNWSSTGTWSATSGGGSGASVPGSGDIAVIEGGYIVTVNSTETCDSIHVMCGSAKDSRIIIDNNGDLTVTNGVLLRGVNYKHKALIEILGQTASPGTVSIGRDLILKAYHTQDDAKVDVKEDGTLTVVGDVLLWTDGNQKAELKIQGNAICTVGGDIIYTGAQVGNSKINMNDFGILNIAGNFDRSAAGNYGDLDCEVNTVVNFNGTSPQTLSMIDYGNSFTNLWLYGDIEINNAAGVTLDANISISDVKNRVDDSIRIQSGQMNSGGFSIELKNGKVFEIADGATYYSTTTDATGGMLQTSSTAYHNIHVNSTVNFAATSAQSVPNPSNSEPYGNITLSGGATKTLVGNINVDGDLLIVASTTLDADVANNYSITLAGDWTDNGTFNEQSAMMTFDGAAAQTVNGVSETYYDLTINNSSGDVSLNTDITVSRTLDLTSWGYRIRVK